MNRRLESSMLLIKVLIDVLLVAAAWALAYYLRFYTRFETPLGIPPPVLYFKLIPFIVVIWLAVFFATGFYRRSQAKRSVLMESFDVVQCSFMATMAFIAFSYFYEEYRYSRLTLMLFVCIHPLLIIAGRSLLRKCLRRMRENAPKKRVLLIGSGGGLRRSMVLVADSGFAAAEVAGAILVGRDEDCEADKSLLRAKKFRELPQPRDWLDFLAQERIQAVYCGLPLSHGAYLNEHLAAIADQVPDIKIVPDLSSFTRLMAGVELVDGSPVISLHESPLVGFGGLIKRIIDVIGAVVALVLFAPVIAAIAALVRLSSPGPILYRQERMGLDGRVFQCLKFRSMPVDAEKSGAVFATADDQRATWLGRVLRRTSLDELPQFFNVLRGDMSLVGPRPERPVFVGQFRGNIPGYMLRHKVKAGMTGWAQVNGWRGNTSIEKRIECDLFYIQNWSVWLDFTILLRTFVEVLFGKNAY